MKFELQEFVEITNGELLVCNGSVGKCSISTDTRTITEGQVYLPLVGANFDGHDFINNAVEKCCKGYFLDKKHKDKINEYKQANFAILVDDTLEAYLKLANAYRKKIDPIVVAVTGSSGKTTTKEMLSSILSKGYKAHKTILNHNNEVGLCQTLLSMPEDTQVLVTEMGMRGPGEIELLSKYAQPDIAIITNIGSAHIGRLGSLENIAKAKCEIVKYLHPEGLFIASDSELLRKTLDWNGNAVFYDTKSYEIIEQTCENVRFIYKGNEYKLNVSGEYNVLNAVAAINAGLRCGLSPALINQGLQEYSPIDKRWQLNKLKDGSLLINDSYNANPDSVKAAIDAVIDTYKSQKIVLVLGDMAELGEHEDYYHRELGKYISDKPVNMLITVGEKAELISKTVKNDEIILKSCKKNSDAIRFLTENNIAGSVILLKASRCMSFEEIEQGIIKELK